MLTPEQIQAARAKLGIQTPTTTPNRVSELDAAWNVPREPSLLERSLDIGGQVLKGVTNPVVGISNVLAKGAQQSFTQGITKDFEERNKNVAESKRRVEAGEQSLASGLYQSVGQAAGLVGDAAFETVKAVTPQPIKDVAKGALGSIGETQQVQDLIKAWQGFEQAHPEEAANIAATGNIASILPIAKGAQLGAQGIAKGVSAGSNVLSKVHPINALKGNLTKVQSQGISNDVDALLGATRSISKRVQTAEAQGTNLRDILSDPQVFKGITVSKSKINPEPAIATIDARIDKLMEAKSGMLPKLDKVTPEIPRDVLRERAYENIASKFSPADEQALIKAIDQQIDALPEMLKPSEIDKLRAQFRKSSRNAQGMQKSTSEYSALENAARDTVFDITDNLPISGASEYKALNEYVKNMITTRDFLDKTLRDQVVKGGRMRGYALKVIGAVAGSTHGPIGAIMGSEVGGLISDIITNNQLGSSIKMRLIQNLTDDPVILKEAQKLLKDVNDLEVPQLPAGGEFRTKTYGNEAMPLPSKTQSTIDLEQAQNTNIKKPVPKKAEGVIPKELGPLAAEARKYKSAEEFMEAQKPLYHGGLPYDKLRFDRIDGISLTPSKSSARIFAGPGDKSVKNKSVFELFLSPKAKIMPFQEIPEDLYHFNKFTNSRNPIDENYQKILQYARDKGYDGVDLRNFGSKEYNEAEIRIINPDVIKTKEQLTDFYNKVKEN